MSYNQLLSTTNWMWWPPEGSVVGARLSQTSFGGKWAEDAILTSIRSKLILSRSSVFHNINPWPFFQFFFVRCQSKGSWDHQNCSHMWQATITPTSATVAQNSSQLGHVDEQMWQLFFSSLLLPNYSILFQSVICCCYCFCVVFGISIVSVWRCPPGVVLGEEGEKKPPPTHHCTGCDSWWAFRCPGCEKLLPRSRVHPSLRTYKLCQWVAEGRGG